MLLRKTHSSIDSMGFLTKKNASKNETAVPACLSLLPEDEVTLDGGWETVYGRSGGSVLSAIRESITKLMVIEQIKAKTP